jgi:hypothetical protein
LRNRGGLLALLNAQREVLFFVSYEEDWLNDLEKQEGGWSLEMVDTRFACTGRSNWRASTAAAGGTPGAENSVAGELTDNRFPEIERVVLGNPQLLLLTLSERPDIDALSAEQFSLSPSVGVAAVSYIFGPEPQIAIALEQPLQQGQVYELTVRNLFDCYGNRSSEPQQELVIVPEAAAPGEVKLSEILFNPASGGVDFVEIVNTSMKYIDLSLWEISNDTEFAPLPSGTFIAPGQFLAFTSDADELARQYPQANAENFVEIDLPAYADDEGLVELVNQFAQLEESFFYMEEYHFPLLRIIDGVSLERISYDLPAENADNWRSAAESAGFATPGGMNSQQMAAAAGADCLELSAPVISAGAVGLPNFVLITLGCEQAQGVGDLYIYDANGQLVNHLVRAQFVTTGSTFRWDGLTSSNRYAPPGRYLILLRTFDNTGNVLEVQASVVIATGF